MVLPDVSVSLPTIPFYDGARENMGEFQSFMKSAVQMGVSTIEVANLDEDQFNTLTTMLLMTPGEVTKIWIRFSEDTTGPVLEEVLGDIGMLDDIKELRLTGLNTMPDHEAIKDAISVYEDETGIVVQHDLNPDPDPTGQTTAGYTGSDLPDSDGKEYDDIVMSGESPTIVMAPTAGHVSDTNPKALSTVDEEEARMHLGRLKDIASKWESVQTARPVDTGTYRLFEQVWKTRSDLFHNAIGIHESV